MPSIKQNILALTVKEKQLMNLPRTQILIPNNGLVPSVKMLTAGE